MFDLFKLTNNICSIDQFINVKMWDKVALSVQAKGSKGDSKPRHLRKRRHCLGFLPAAVKNWWLPLNG